MEARTVAEQIKAIKPDTVVKLVNEYGWFWIGKAMYVFSAITAEAWDSAEIKVVVCK